MTLNSNYTYLFLDFETTGLDLSSDFPMQIALIQTDHNLKVIKTYNSYISLPESITKLRSNVSYMTGIDIETIESQWQSLDTIQSEITAFFWWNTILIGQNISFDIGFLKKFFSWCTFAYSIDTYPLAASSIPYLKSYSLESIDHHLTEKYDSYNDQKSYLLTTLSGWKILSAHDALYDCIIGICFIWRWYNQINNLTKDFPILSKILSKTSWEWIIKIVTSPLIPSGRGVEGEGLPILTSPLTEKKQKHSPSSVNRDKVPNHSKRSTKWVDVKTIIPELPHPCIIAVSHGSKIDIIKRACPDESFDYLKEEQIIDQDKLSLWLSKASYTEEERLFVLFYLSHHRDGYRILHPTLTTHKHILDYLQIKKIESKKDKKVLCSHGWLYYTIQNNPNRKIIYKDYPICILDADRRHTTYNDYAQKGIALTSILYQREKFEYELQQINTTPLWYYDTIKNLITSLTFFIAYFAKESEQQYHKLKQNKREIDYLLQHQAYNNTANVRSHIWEQRNALLENSIQPPQYLIDSMNKLSNFFQNPLKIQRNINQNKDIYYMLAPAVRYIDFAEYLKMFEGHRVFFFSPARSEYQSFLPSNKNTKLPTIYEDNTERTIQKIEALTWSIFIISHNTEKSKKLFALLHEQWFDKTYTLIGEYLTWWVAKNAIKQSQDKPNIIIGGYHMLLHFWGEGTTVDHIIIHYIHNAMKNFIEDDIQQYARVQ